MSIVDLVFRTRTLLGKCELGAGLDFDEIDDLSRLEAAFRPGADDLYPRDGRLHHREPVVLGALVRGTDINDRVAVRDLSPGGAQISGAPYMTEGDVLEVVIDAERLSYRFKAQVQWVDDDGDDYRAGVQFLGLPVCLSYGPESEAAVESVIHKIAIAA